MKLKKYFIPHNANDYKPHIFRVRAVLGMTAVIGFFFLFAFSLNTIVIRSGSSMLGSVVSSVLTELTNTDRAGNKLAMLTVSPNLERVAQMKANDMAEKGYFAHTSPEGKTPWYWFRQAGYNYSYAGENLAVYFSDSAELEKAWMNSPSHRANILNSNFTEVGIAMALGTYQGVDTVYVVQAFGRPSRRVASAPVKNTEVLPVKNIPAGTTTDKLAVAEKPIVKGAATPPEEMFIAIENNEEPAVAPEENLASGTPVVAKTAAEDAAPTILKVVASPKTLLKTVYSFLAIFIAIALVLMIGIEIKRQHPRHIAYGVALLALMAILLYVWQSFFFGTLLIV
ncbi:MAG: CAP domain-containing protein [Candidatus Paceibacterota bacterium]|jgi:hypothetical protein